MHWKGTVLKIETNIPKKKGIARLQSQFQRSWVRYKSRTYTGIWKLEIGIEAAQFLSWDHINEIFFEVCSYRAEISLN